MYNSNYFNNRQPYYTPVSYQPQGTLVEIRKLSADQIKGFIPPIGSQMLLIDEANSLAYMVSSDVYGNMYKQPYNFSVVSPDNTVEVKKEDSVVYVTKDDLTAAVDKINKEIEELKIKQE